MFLWKIGWPQALIFGCQYIVFGGGKDKGETAKWEAGEPCQGLEKQGRPLPFPESVFRCVFLLFMN